jgi:methylmalonyl-CoA mutase
VAHFGAFVQWSGRNDHDQSGMTMSDALFSSTFALPTPEQWRALVDGVLKGRDFERTLVNRTYDGLRIQPLYPKAEGARPVSGRAAGAPWSVTTRIDHIVPRAANAQALEDLQNGATGLHLVFFGSVGSYGFGLPDGKAETIAAALDGVVLDAGIHLELDLSLMAKDAALAFCDLVATRKLDPAAVDVSFGFDPMSQAALLGGTPVAWTELAPLFAGLAKEIAGRGFRGPIASADGRLVHAAGGSEAQELAFALGSAVAYLRALEAGGVALDEARRMIGFRLAADADQFLSLAKMRALRQLWARVEEACGLAPEPLRLHAETAWRMMTRRDPWVNLLRSTVAVFAAGTGGADSLSVLPFTQALGLPDGFARRLARNTQLILLEESNLARVADPAAGSGGVEALTTELAGKAWALFQADEAQGGIAAALAAGTVQERVTATRREREAAVARRRDPLTGTSELPNIDEAPVPVLAPAAPLGLPSFGQSAALEPMRLSEPFEALRDADDEKAAAGKRPRVFLATLGPVAAFTARAMFAKNLFEAGGIAAPVNDGFLGADGKTDLAALTAAFKASGAGMACLCSSDELYAAEAAEAAQTLRAAGCATVWLAGKPGELESGLRAAGVNGFIHAGMDVLSAIGEAQKAA